MAVIELRDLTPPTREMEKGEMKNIFGGYTLQLGTISKFESKGCFCMGMPQDPGKDAFGTKSLTDPGDTFAYVDTWVPDDGSF